MTNQKYGDVNLWGHEGPPSLEKSEELLKKDLEILTSLFESLDKLEKRDLLTFDESPTMINDQLVNSGKMVINSLSHRIKHLRSVKKKKEMTLNKLKSVCTSEQMKSKYSYAISALKTYIYQINACISRLLKSIDLLGKIIAICNGVGELYQCGPICDLRVRENYVCLTGPECIPDSRSISTSSTVKQRSDVWFDIRKLAKVTGSSCHQALGLSGLKKMKDHFENVVNSKEKPLPTEETEKRMRHGVENEINGIATLVSKILPVYYPNAVYFEEGCEITKHNDEPFLVTSPDGSLRTLDIKDLSRSITEMGVEVKCPYPGKIYTTPVYNQMPWYYVTQVLCEMHALQVPILIFICYSEESTTVFKANFDEQLWEEIMNRLLDTYGKCSPVLMKKLPAGMPAFSKRIKEFCEENVTFLAEVPSLKAISECNHPSVSQKEEEIGHHSHNEMNKDKRTLALQECTIPDMLTNWYEMKESLLEANSLGRHLASEVLVFLISDLDRVHKRERQHAVPVAYALKGYSLTSDLLREMLDEVLKRCFELGLYVPAVSYDGQWSKVSVRSSSGAPLTMFNCKKMSIRKLKRRQKRKL